MQKLRPDMNIGGNIQKIRYSRKLTQDQVIAKMNLMGIQISKSTYAKLETNRMNIKVSELVAMKEIFECEFNDFFEEKENLYDKVPELDKATLMKWMKKAAVAISEKLKSARNNTSRRLITDAKNVVAERYMEPDFSLDTVCSVLGVSNSYFSTIFKKETGKN